MQNLALACLLVCRYQSLQSHLLRVCLGLQVAAVLYLHFQTQMGLQDYPIHLLAKAFEQTVVSIDPQEPQGQTLGLGFQSFLLSADYCLLVLFYQGLAWDE